jgi:pimeloyl-ACP methyl ester carboxylesterase
MEQQIRFCTTDDGVRLAYAQTGKGPPLVKVSNWLSHLERDWGRPVWRHWLAELSRDHTFIRYDERGCGLSDWDVPELSFEAWVRDLETVVDAVGAERRSARSAFRCSASRRARRLPLLTRCAIPNG